ncbi:hypothetical protein, partial [Methylobacterium sp. Leaf106]|uniref:hypothetical protein n=1 Tax=Methylobacterium sp. Leaf106 TaxID=1736255 RepID=UPI001AEC4CC1
PANQPDHPSDHRPEDTNASPPNRSPRWPPPMNRLLEAARRAVNAKIAKLIDFRDKRMTTQHNSLPANKDSRFVNPAPARGLQIDRGQEPL